MADKPNTVWHLDGFAGSYNRRAWSLAAPTGEELKPLLGKLAEGVEASLVGRTLPVGAVVALRAPVQLPLHPFPMYGDVAPVTAQWTVAEGGALELDIEALWRQLQHRLIVRRN